MLFRSCLSFSLFFPPSVIGHLAIGLPVSLSHSPVCPSSSSLPPSCPCLLTATGGVGTAVSVGASSRGRAVVTASVGGQATLNTVLSWEGGGRLGGVGKREESGGGKGRGGEGGQRGEEDEEEREERGYGLELDRKSVV